MKERPILFNAPMVRAIIDGRKTQTRRIMKPQPTLEGTWVQTAIRGGTASYGSEQGFRESHPVWCPHGWEGDQLWVRETIELATLPGNTYPSPVYSADGAHVMDGVKKASNHQFMKRRVTPSIHMPRWASRITLEITGIHVERLQDISEEDALAEGIQAYSDGTYRDYNVHDDKVFDRYTYLFASPIDSYRTLWDTINGPGSWDANPWVWVIEFRRIKP